MTPLVVVALILVGGLAASRLITRATALPAAGALALIAATPLVPQVPLAFGLSYDDLLPLLGLALLVPMVPWRRLRLRGTAEIVLLIGLGLIVLSGVPSSAANGDGPSGAVTLLARSSGRFLFLGAITAAALAVVVRNAGLRLVVPIAFAAAATFEAVFGLWAYFVGFPDMIGLEPTKPSSPLHGAVPGRISGTLGNSPDFLGAVFVVAIPLTIGLALEARSTRSRLAWWFAISLQFLALLLTFTRSSLGLVAVAAVAMVLLSRGRLWHLVPLSALVLAVALGTPMLSRLTSDVPDRLALWTSAVTLFVDHPLTGVGAGRMREAASADPGRYQRTPFGFAGNNAHNTVFLAAAELGIGGALGALLLNLGIAAAALRVVLGAVHRRAGPVATAGAVAMLAFLAQGMVNNLFTVGTTSVIGALVLGGVLLPAARAQRGEAD